MSKDNKDYYTKLTLTVNSPKSGLNEYSITKYQSDLSITDLEILLDALILSKTSVYDDKEGGCYDD